MKSLTWLGLSISLVRAQSSSSSVNYAQYVNPLIGSEGPMPGQAFGGGDIFVGGAVPFGVVKFGIGQLRDQFELVDYQWRIHTGRPRDRCVAHA